MDSFNPAFMRLWLLGIGKGSFRPLQGREQAAIDYNKEVEHIVKEATEGNTYIKAADHWEHIADFLGHLVAASFAFEE